MSQEPIYTVSYILNREHLSECFDQSVTVDTSIKAYYKAIGLFFVGVALLMTTLNGYASWFIIGLGVLEALSVRYKKTWWLWRQLLGRSSGNELTLTIDNQGVKTHSDLVDSFLKWTEISNITPTEKGFLLKHQKGTLYLSSSILDEATTAFIHAKSGQE